MPHATVGRIRKEDISNPQKYTIKPLRIFSSGVFPRREANATAITSIFAHLMDCEIRLLHQPQTHQSSHTVVCTLDKCIPTSKRMCPTAAPVTIGQKTNKNDPHTAQFIGVCVVCGVVCCEFYGFLPQLSNQPELWEAIHMGVLLRTRRIEFRCV